MVPGGCNGLYMVLAISEGGRGTHETSEPAFETIIAAPPG